MDDMKNDNREQKSKRSATPFIIAIIIILALVVGWFLLLPALGITLALTAGAWGAIVSTITVVCIAIVLFFIFAGVGIFIFGFLAFLWALIAIILFPVFFPLIAPLLVILLLIGFLVRRKRSN